MITDMEKSGKKKQSLGLYIHVPFCKQKCLYCDFCSLPKADPELISEYHSSLLRCIGDMSERAVDYEVDTIYLGGGTPTVMSARQIDEIINKCAKKYAFSSNVEISCECNPATGSESYFSDLRKSGINRMSIGLQSANDDELKALGRIHGYGDFLRTYAHLRDAGFNNISADLMYGIPQQTMESFLQSIKELAKISPEHISTYCLKVEERTPYGKMGSSLILPDDDTQYEMYMMCSSILKEYGYEKYEISNFSKPQRESRHNMRYWLGYDYIGFGASAHSYFMGERFAFSDNVRAFASGDHRISQSEKIVGDEIMREYVMLRMRLAKGISLAEFFDKFGRDFCEVFPCVSRFEKSGHILLDENRCAFSDKGFFVSSYILSEMLDFS